MVLCSNYKENKRVEIEKILIKENKATMRELGFDERKKIELEILIEFDKFCKENGLTYFLAYGTLIGAIRHKGFIPWDDDIDINMPRKDYCWFVENYNKKNLNGRYKAVSPKMPEAQHTFLKFIDTKTLKIEPNIKYEYGCLGIDIDIFPLDGQPEDEKKYNRWYDNLMRIYRFFGLCGKDNTGNIKIKRRIALLVIKPLTGGRKKLLRKAERLHQKYPYDISKYIGSIESAFDERSVRFPKEWFAKSIFVEFEGHKLPVPVEYDKVLKKIYGNYMEFPPKEEQKIHHINRMFLLEGEESLKTLSLRMNNKGEIYEK
jgi:lipopolysaccharide cholinephosphotransferase